MKKTGTKGFTTVVLLLVIVGLGYYTYLNNNIKNNRDVSKMTESEELLNYNFENDYPKTVRETVKLHCRYLKSIYNGSFTEDELFTINKQIRQLLDDDLLAYNSEAQQLQALEKDIQLYKDRNQKFISYSLAEASQIKYNTEDGIDYAKIKVDIAMRLDKASVSVEEEYILRKNKDGKWKILGWQTVNNQTTEYKGDTD